MVQKRFENKLLSLLLLIACLAICQCRPSEDAANLSKVDPSDYPGNLPPETILKVQQCERDQATMELCMRCAKITKSQIIYPMCCNNDDDIKVWCHEYVYYNNEEGY
ncbi:uncharacterized protein LOC6580552 [Drosophila mojavensis]|uniref:Uncharacterized protein n=1 Tax=Drosophila mojavensis TaxID=7230 RepID=B4KQH8_DROMO|nr:uncharacterized protein LOC6580552 [Drosophila mojavensis]EDW10318.2 uncharacterized protein Dmoj_GI21015 [Drosophila mojavensis]